MYDVVLFNKRFPKSLEISMEAISQEEKEEKDKKKAEKISFDLTKFFKDNNYMEGINKL